jgi:alkylation response protein AidB-like acyl-CoA dehydrogenase
MRGTYSPSVTFTNVRIGHDATLGPPGAALQLGVIEIFALGYAAVYLGIAEAAVEFALDYLRQRVVRPENVSVAQDPTVQRHVGGLVLHLDAAKLVLGDSAARWEAADLVGRGDLANRAKAMAAEVSLDITSKTIQIVGGRGAYRDFPLERAFRDVRTSTLMPPTMDRMLETIGKTALGLAEGMFKVTPGPQGV